MTTKRCSYKDCNVYTSSSHPVSETFYSFPKHPERLKLWMELGGCSDHREIPYASRYFCSKHFDESKYVANNPRRKQLLSTAVPFPYSESLSQNDSNIDDNDYQCVVSTVHTLEEEEDDITDDKFHTEVSVEVSNEINCISESIEEALDSYEEFNNEVTGPTDFEEAIETEKRTLKRKIELTTKQISLLHQSANQQPGSSKRRVVAISNRPTSTINVHHTEDDHHKVLYEETDENTTPSESSNITTFIFRGEEYIQMPKEQYNREKMVLINKIRKYEEIIKNVKDLVDI